MKRHSILLTLLALFTLFMGSVAQAQEGFDLCFGLAEADCAAINAASANGIGDAESFTLDLSIDLAVDNIAEEGMTAFTFAMDGALDFAMSDSETGVAMAGAFDLSFSQNGGDVTEQTIELALVDDFAYFNVDGEGWQSVDLMRLIEDETFTAQLDAFGVDADTGEIDEAMMEDLPVDPMALMPLLQILDLPGFLNYERMGDDFVFTIDLSALQALLEEENEELLNSIIEVASEVDPSAAFFIPAIPALINTGTITVTQTIDPNLNIINHIGFDVNLEANLLQLSTGDPQAPATTVFLDVDLGISNLDGVSGLEAPADAEDITDTLLMMFGAAVPTDE